jgi:pimeloyl-ACP methyl ester carboxylesterase
VSATVQRAVNGDVAIAFEARGEGPPLLLIMGLGYGRWGWAPVVEPLASRHLVLAFDNRGYGDSDVPAGPYTAAQLAGDALAVLDTAGVERAHVVGASLGGAVALELALRHPERIDKLVLVATMSGTTKMHPIPAPTQQLMAAAPALDPAVALRRFVENALEPEPERELVDRIVALRTANPPDPAGWAAQAGVWSSFDVWDELPGIAAPTLVVQGEGDVVVDPRNAAALAARIPGARLQLVAGGHLFFWKRPAAFVSLLTEFLG